jgi:hypothetical protein
MASEQFKHEYASGDGVTGSPTKATKHHQPSLLSQEEQEQLKPKDVIVENPWIYEQTHQEYLENIKVSFSRRALRSFDALDLF